MTGVAVEGGGIRGDDNGVEGHWGEGLGLATEDGSGVAAVSPCLNVVLLFYHLDSPFNSRHIIYFILAHAYSNYRKPLLKGVLRNGKGIVAVMFRMYLVWLDVRMCW